MFTVYMHYDLLTYGIRTFFQTFSTISSSTLVVYTLIILDTLRVKISTKHESEQTLGNKLYPIWLPSCGIIFLFIWKFLVCTNFQSKLSCIWISPLNISKLPWSYLHFEHSTASNIHCSYSLVCLPVFALCFLVPFIPLILFCSSRERQEYNPETARLVYPPGSTLNMSIS